MRLLARLKRGMINEVKKLKRSGLSWKRLESFGLEYRYVALFLQKKVSREEMLAGIERDSFQYAKRQMTWFKRNKEIHWIASHTQAVQLVKKFLVN